MIAQTLKKNIRNTDFLARYGGEEFVVILPETSQKQAQELAERLRKAVAKKKKKLTISVGVTCFTEKSKIKNSKKLVIQADKALYHYYESRAPCGARLGYRIRHRRTGRSCLIEKVTTRNMTFQ